MGHVDDAPSVMSPQQNTSPRLVSAKVLGSHFNPPRCERTIRSWQAARVIPFRKVGRLVLFDPVEVFGHLDKYHRVEPRRAAL